MLKKNKSLLAAAFSSATAKQVALLGMPPLLLGSTRFVYQRLVARFGLKRGYFGGFLFYWLLWCLLVPLWVLGGPRRLPEPLKEAKAGQLAQVDLLLLAGPPLVGYLFAFPRALRRSNPPIILASAAIALVNATAEELLWRGTYRAAFPNRFVLGYLYPSAGFAVWHLAPQSVVPSRYSGGAVSYVISSGVFGLLWGRVAARTGSIRWAVLSHVLLDFSGLGAHIYFDNGGYDER